MEFSRQDHEFMERALSLALKAQEMGEVPVGAVVVHDGKVVGEAANRRETQASPIAHAEILAIEEASKKLGAWRLLDTTLYVTLEPCLMCSGAIINSRIPRVVFATTDPKAGAVISLFQTLSDTRLNHRPTVMHGLMADRASGMLKAFFQKRRMENTEG
jgi:tRNA(adenine34) deaminase